MDQIPIALVTFFVANQGIKFFMKKFRGIKDAKPKVDRKPTAYDKYTKIFLILAIVFVLLLGVYDLKTTRIEKLGITSDTQTFVIRNRFREYMVSRHGLFTEYPTKEEYDRFKMSTGTVDINAENLLKKSDEDQLAYIRDHSLYTQIKDKSFRSAYLKYGANIALDCYWCKKDIDYAVYALPKIVADYSLFFIVLGFATINPRFRLARKWGIYIVGAYAVIELYHIMLTALANSYANEDYYSNLLIFDSIEYKAFSIFRRLLFISIFIGALTVWNTVHTVLESDIILRLVRSIHSGFSTQQSAGFIRAAVMTDPILRSRTMENAERRSVLTESMNMQPAYKNARRKALRGQQGFKELLQKVRQDLAIGLFGVLEQEELPQGEPIGHEEEIIDFWTQDGNESSDAELDSMDNDDLIKRTVGAERRGSSLGPVRKHSAASSTIKEAKSVSNGLL